MSTKKPLDPIKEATKAVKACEKAYNKAKSEVKHLEARYDKTLSPAVWDRLDAAHKDLAHHGLSLGLAKTNLARLEKESQK